MPTPTGSTAWAYSNLSGDAQVNALIYGTQWFSHTISYSFIGTNSYFSVFYEENNLNANTLRTNEKVAVKSALQSWSNVAALNFVETTESMGNAGDLRFGYSWLQETSDAQAWAYAPGGAYFSGDVWFNRYGSSFYTPWTSGSYEYLTAVHEIGHALGLKHSFGASFFNTTLLEPGLDSRSFTVMSYSALPGNPSTWFSFEPTTPMILDVDAIQHLYGANTSFNVTDTTYIFEGGRNYHQTIWDAGGTDTIVYASNSSGIIDLRPGVTGGSALGNTIYVQNSAGQNLMDVKNIWIATEAIIENAVGGSGDDHITGNHVANALKGNAGNDRMTGGGGDDVIDCGEGAEDQVTYDLDVSNYTIRYSQGVCTITALSGAEGTDTVIGAEYLQFGNQVIAVTVFDLEAPTVVSFNPEDEATGVKSGGDIKVTFNEKIQRGTGSIVLKDAANHVIATYDAATSSNLSISGDTLTINPTADLGYNTQYFVLFDAGSIQDLAGNNYAGTASYDFTTGAVVPLTLIGSAAANTLNGDAGNDILAGLGGTDALNGAEGADIYLMTLSTDHVAAEINDTGSSGVDEVRFTSTKPSTLTLYAADRGIEQIVIGTGTAASAVTTGTTANNVNAALLPNGVTMLGNHGANSLIGTGYNDTLDGNAGKDKLFGGAGNDLYIVDLLATGLLQDTVTESSAVASEIDTIRLRGGFTLASSTSVASPITLGTHVENLDASFVAASTGALQLVGNASANTITGSSGRDVIHGAGGLDALWGGDGHDLFVIASAQDHVSGEVINGGGGLDEIRFTSATASTLTLSSRLTDVEYITVGTGTGGAAVATGSAALNVDASAVNYGLSIAGNKGANVLVGSAHDDGLVGNAGNDTLHGGSGNDTLWGGLGNDYLTGGAGGDRFVLDTLPNAKSNIDTITDFVPGTDVILLDDAVMAGLILASGATSRALTPDEFWSGAGANTAHDETDRIFYNTTSGALYYDADGSGSKAAVQIAMFSASPRPALTHNDFSVF